LGFGDGSAPRASRKPAAPRRPGFHGPRRWGSKPAQVHVPVAPFGEPVRATPGGPSARPTAVLPTPGGARRHGGDDHPCRPPCGFGCQVGRSAAVKLRRAAGEVPRTAARQLPRVLPVWFGRGVFRCGRPSAAGRVLVAAQDSGDIPAVVRVARIGAEFFGPVGSRSVSGTGRGPIGRAPDGVAEACHQPPAVSGLRERMLNRPGRSVGRRPAAALPACSSARAPGDCWLSRCCCCNACRVRAAHRPGQTGIAAPAPQAQRLRAATGKLAPHPSHCGAPLP